MYINLTMIWYSIISAHNTTSLSLANFVGCVVGFLNVFIDTSLEPPSCSLVIL
jgi:hypothetical protein